MPELPEVETIRRQLQSLIVGKTISSIRVLNPLSFRVKPDSLIGKIIAGVGRKGKVLILDLKKDSKQIFVHLKMSGQLRYRYFKISISPPSDNRHLRVLIKFSNRDCLEFLDQRKFGWITDNPAVLPMGIDALDSGLTAGKLSEILKSSNRPVKTILLDQSKIAGIGNIYASEILWESGVSPWVKFKDEGRRPKAEGKFKSKTKIQKLRIAIHKVLNDAIASGGSTMDDGLYLHVGGESGSYWSRRRVYDREREPCLRCKTPIKKGVIGQRSTYWCPECQMVR